MNRVQDTADARGFLISALNRLQLHGPDAAGAAMVLALAAFVVLAHDEEAVRYAHQIAQRAIK